VRKVTENMPSPKWVMRSIGVITPLHYSEVLDNPPNKKFVKAFVREAEKGSLLLFRRNLYWSKGGLWRLIKAINGR